MKNIKKINISRFLAIFVTVVFFLGCKSAPKGEISSSANPRDEIERLSYDLKKAQERNVDVLARNEYLKSKKFLEKAKDHLTEGKAQEKIIDDLRFGRDFLKKAFAKSERNQGKVPGLFEARQSAIKAGASQSSELRKEWTGLDEDVAADAKDIDNVSIDTLNLYQARYVELEKQAVIESQLGKVKSQVKGALSDGAKKKAPQTLRQTELSLINAESLIGSNLKNPSEFSPSVVQAKNDAQFLSEIMETIKQNGKSLSEAAAIKMVLQKRQISDMDKSLSVAEGTINEAVSRLNEKNKNLQQKEVDLDRSQASVALQSVLEKSRQQFSPDEAETYQQGKNLLIRLKAMNFKIGGYELPEHSLVLLNKVSEVAKELNAKELKVEGHTDSVGSSKRNQWLSEKRANAVATYFKVNGFEDTEVVSEGHGFENPIATNKSKEGRSQNRRVDIIITPKEAKVQ
ncbi:MAG: OmpA family protein [Bdellovibrionales bacterium]|nr:OmpA family protein [Bdellovibrionales bacterium]